MIRQLASLTLCGFTILGAGCATKSFVEQQVGATEAKLNQRVSATEAKLTQQASATETKLTEQETKLTDQVSATEGKLSEQLGEMETKLSQRASATESKLTERVGVQETQLRETADRVGTIRQAIAAANHQLKGLDTTLGGVSVLVADAKTRAEAAHDANARLSQRLAGRNSYRLLESRSLYFEPDRADIRTEDINELEQVAKALKAEINAVLELEGYADPRGTDRYNNQLARERVDAVTRYLVQRHGIELRQVHALSMGKAVLGPGEKPSTQAFAKARRVDIRLLAPWSSWEDAAAARMGEAAPTQGDTVTQPSPREASQPPPATSVVSPLQPESAVPSVQPEPIRPAHASLVDPAGGTSPTSIEPDEPAMPENISRRSGHDGDEPKNGAPRRALLEILNNISPVDLGGK